MLFIPPRDVRLMFNTFPFGYVLQPTGHEEAARSAALVFICVHREHYDFLETLAPQLKKKVPHCQMP